MLTVCQNSMFEMSRWDMMLLVNIIMLLHLASNACKADGLIVPRFEYVSDVRASFQGLLRYP